MEQANSASVIPCENHEVLRLRLAAAQGSNASLKKSAVRSTSPSPFGFAQGAAYCRGWGRMTELFLRNGTFAEVSFEIASEAQVRQLMAHGRLRNAGAVSRAVARRAESFLPHEHG
jgi:hypothetical protein